MQLYGKDQVLYSLSDLVTFLECKYASFRDWKQLTTPIELTDDDQTSKLLQSKGIEHEQDYLQQLKKSGKKVVEIPTAAPGWQRVLATKNAMRSGAEVIYQAAFFDFPWRGDADFLIRSHHHSLLGDYSYEVLEAKLAWHPEPKHILQLCGYAELLAKLQGTQPGVRRKIHLLLGTKEKQSFLLDDFYYYYLHAKKLFVAYLSQTNHQVYPEPCRHCDFCRWQPHCKDKWLSDDHLSLVANIRHDNIVSLNQAGIKKLADLAQMPPDKRIPNLQSATKLRLIAQAKLQHYKATTGEDKYVFLPPAVNRGFDRLPDLSAGDLFFDIEG